jgi:hypothetical protein
MERYIRTIFNFTFVVPLLLSWGLLVKNKFFKNFPMPNIETSILSATSRNIQQEKKVFVNPAAKLMEKRDVAVEIPPAAVTESVSDSASEVANVDAFELELAKVKNHLKILTQFERVKHELPKVEVASLEQETSANIETTPDYDETLIEISDHIINERPLISKYINTIFSRNIMRSIKEEGRRAIALKGEALLANGPKGIVVSKNNLQFLEATFARFKTRYGIYKVVISSPEGYNNDYSKKISKFAKNYFSYPLEFVTDRKASDGYEIILVGDQL